MRALSIRQPYAEQILCGIKRFEYRSRPTAIRERVYIYAARKPGPAKEFERMRIQPGDLPTGVREARLSIFDCLVGRMANRSQGCLKAWPHASHFVAAVRST